MSDVLKPENLMEALVDAKLDSLIKDTGVCGCARCRADIFALTLNNLPPKYIVSVGGNVFSRFLAMEAQFQADVTAQILNSIKKIKENPRHDGSLDNRAL